MASIGSVSCDIVEGVAQKLTERVIFYQVPGVDGYGAQKLGKGNAPFRYRVSLYDTNTNIETWIDNLKALEGDTVTITDDFGNARTNCLIGSVIQQPTRAATEASKFRGQAIVEGVMQPST